MRIFFIIFLSIYFFESRAQCPEQDDVYIYTQNELDSILNIYPDCTELGTLHLIGAEIYDISGLSRFTKFKSVEVNETNITTLRGLENIVQIKKLTISDNNELAEVSDFTYQGDLEQIQFSRNQKLREINIYCNNITESIVFIADSTELTQVAFTSPNDISLERFETTGNVQFEFLNKFYVSDKFYVIGNNNYKSIDELNVLFSIDSLFDFYVGEMKRFSLEGIGDLSYMKNVQFKKIDTVDFIALPQSNFSCEFLGLVEFKIGFENLKYLDNLFLRKLELSNLPFIENLNDLKHLENLHSIGLGVMPKLNDISRLSLVDSFYHYDFPYIGALHIINNPLVSDCSIEPICKKLNSNYNFFELEIYGNLGECEDEDAVKSSCISSTEDQISHLIKIYPNPVFNIITIDIPAEITEIKIYNIFGQLEATFLNQSSIDVSGIPAGIKIIEINSNENLKYWSKITKVQ